MRKPIIEVVSPLAALVIAAACSSPLPGPETTDPPRGDTAAPTAHIAFPPPHGLTDDDAITVRGTASDQGAITAVTVNGVAATTTDGYASWQATVPLTHGVNTLTVATEDAAGNAEPNAAAVAVELSEAPARFPAGLAWDPERARALVIDQGTATAPGAEPALLAYDLAGTREIVSGVARGAGPVMNWPTSVAWDPVGGRALVTDAGLGALLAIDVETGARTVAADAVVGSGIPLLAPISVAWDTVRDRALVLDAGQHALFGVDAVTGARQLITAAPIAVGAGQAAAVLTNPSHIAWDPIQNRALTLWGNDDFYSHWIVSIDVATGAASLFHDLMVDGCAGATGLEASGLTWDPAANRALVTVRSNLENLGVVAIGGATGGCSAVTSAFWLGVDETGQGLGSGPLLQRPAAITWDPVADRALVVDSVHSAVVAVDPGTGDRDLISEFATGSGPRLAVTKALLEDPTSGHTFVATEMMNSVMTVDPSGARAFVSSSARGVGPQMDLPQAMAWTADGSRLLVLDLLLESWFPGLLAIDMTTGDRTLLAAWSEEGGPLTPGAPVRWPVSLALAPDPDHVLVGDSSPGALFSIEVTTGQSTIISNTATGAGPSLHIPDAMFVDPAAGRALVYDIDIANRAYQVLSVDLASGDRTVLTDTATGSGPALTDPRRGAFDDTGSRVFAMDGRAAIVAIDVATGARTVVSDANTGNGPRLGSALPIAWSARSGLLLVGDRIHQGLLVVDPVTGARVIRSR